MSDPIKEEALAKGVHEECYEVGPDQACEPCRRIVLDVFGRRYDHVEPGSVRTAIARDMMGWSER